MEYLEFNEWLLRYFTKQMAIPAYIVTGVANVAKQIDPKPTTYRNIRYESRLEARWAVILDNTPNVLHFEYHPETWRLPNGWTYTPDFLITYFIPDHRPCKIYLEIKPTVPNDDYILTLEAHTKLNKKTVFILAGPIFGEIEVYSTMIDRGKTEAYPLDKIFKDFVSAYLTAANYRFDL